MLVFLTLRICMFYVWLNTFHKISEIENYFPELFRIFIVCWLEMTVMFCTFVSNCRNLFRILNFHVKPQNWAPSALHAS